MSSLAVPDSESTVVYLQSDTATREFFAAVQHEPLIAVDTEAASFHRYHDRTYLIQVSTRDRTAVIDPLVVTDLEPLGKILSDESVEIIFHDADYDLRMLDRDYGFHATRIFDTRLAAQLVNEPGVGLAALLEKYLRVTLDKRFQRADWSRRPLLPEMLAYAAMDTKHLPVLRDILHHRLVELDRWQWAEEEFRLLSNIRWTPGNDEGFWKIKGAKLLRGHSISVLRELYQWRDDVARQLDRASFRVLNNETLIELARELPQSTEALKGIKGLSPETVHRRGLELVDAVARGLSVAEGDIPRPERGLRLRPDPGLIERLERLKVARNQAALRLDVAPGVLCPNWVLEAVAREEPETVEALGRIPELRSWQKEVLGEELVGALTRPATP
jgi:ribonuclease D